ncbi:MAG: hypothetical protein RJB38_1008 [Pseudomonadota bacterium]|jgi:diaminopimelate decarboxylase
MSRPLDFFGYQNGQLSAGGIELSEITKKVGTPVYVYSADGFLSPLQALQKGLSPLRESTICYAVKSNSSLAILKLLGSAGAGADLVSGGELYRAKLAEIAPEKIVFSGVGKTAEEILSGLRYGPNGIYSFHVESIEELKLIQETAKRHQLTARVAFRLNPNINPKTHPYISTGLKRNKFGLQREELLEAAKLSVNMSHVQLCGLSIHIGSQLLSLDPLKEAFLALSQVIGDVEAIISRPLEFADLGGGVGVSYELKGPRPPRLSDYTKLIVKAFGARSVFKSRLRVLIEPGRTLSANAGVLVTQVLFRKHRRKKDFLIVDAGMNDLIRPALYQSKHAVVPVRRNSRGKSFPTDLVGPVCESSDCFASEIPLSSQLQAGDQLALLSSGAYGMSMAGTYNSRVRPAEVLIKDGQWRVIRDRETLEDLVRGEHL